MSSHPYQMGIWESFLYMCGYIRKDRIGEEPAGLCRTDEELSVAAKMIEQDLMALEAAERHFPNKQYSHWARSVRGVYIHYTDGVKVDLVAEDADGYLLGWVPKGNTGGANVSALKPMPLPSDLSELLQDFHVWLDVFRRVVIWVLLAVCVSAALSTF